MRRGLSFRRWLITRRHPHPDVNDLADDARDDPNWPRGPLTRDRLMAYLNEQNACDGALAADEHAYASYLEWGATAALAELGADTDARHVAELLLRLDTTSTTVRDLLTALPRRRFRRVAHLDDALDVLTDHGWITRMEPPDRRGQPGRPPSLTVLIHPPMYAKPSRQEAPP